MSQALAYVEENLAGEIDQEKLARIACCSAYNFYRMFSFITDISLTEYIRRRRLTLAAIELQADPVKVIDLAMKYGYDSPVSFTRAFQGLHGVTPTAARAGGVTLKAYPRISFQISVKGEREMEYRIEKKEAFQVFGIAGVFQLDGGGAEPSNPHALWGQSETNGAYEKLESAAGSLPPFVSPGLCKVHGVCDYKQTPPGTFSYMQCAFRSGDSQVEGYPVVDVPAYTWAIFPSERFSWDKVVDSISALWKRMDTEWLPTSEYERAGDINFEVYGGDEKQGYVELWIPVRKKT